MAMHRATRWFRWTMAAYFAAMVAAGTSLHFAPGCGHFQHDGCGCTTSCVCPLGHAHEEEGAPEWGDSHEDPLQSAEDCPICRFVSTASQVVQAVVLELSLPLAECLPALVQSPLAIRIPRAFAARAPPVT